MCWRPSDLAKHDFDEFQLLVVQVMMCWKGLKIANDNDIVVSVAGCLGYDVLEEQKRQYD